VDCVLSSSQLADFENNGFLHVPGAFSRDVADNCVEVIWTEIEGQGVLRDDPETWTRPVVRVNCPDTEAFSAAGTSPPLWEAYDQLLGAGTWERRQGVGGTIPVRFPSDADPGDAGWHIDGSYGSHPDWFVNVRSRNRGLLCLFLFTDIGADDAPTRIRVGSHLDVPPLLTPYGDAGTVFNAVNLPASTRARPLALATGNAGDVYVCHPFLVHAASWPHNGSSPRMIAQPGIAIHEPFALDEPAGPVERAILHSLSGVSQP